MSTVLILALAAGGAFLFYKMIRKSLETQNKSWLAITGIIMVLVVMIVVAAAGGAGHKKTVTTRAYVPQSEPKAEKPAPTPEEIEARRLAEEKKATEREARRQKAMEDEQRRKEEQAAREAERAANRLTVAEFETLFLDRVSYIFQTMGVADYATMGEPTRYVNGDKETLTYPLDETGDLKMKVYAKNGGVTGLTVSTNNLSRETLFTVSVLYNVAALQVLSAPSEPEANNILQALSLNENIFNNLSKSQSTTLNGYRYYKSSSGKNFSLSATEQ